MIKLLSCATLILVLTLSLSGCAGNSPVASGSPKGSAIVSNDAQARVSALIKDGKKVRTVIEVPAPDSFIAELLMSGATKMGATSTAAASLTELLKASALPTITVVGRSDRVTAAAIASAIDGLQGAPTRTIIYFAGEQTFINDLQAVAQPAGVPLETTVYPR